MAGLKIDEILDFAIEEEENARLFYLDLAAKMENPKMKEVFEQFAQEELGHKKKLQNIKARESIPVTHERVQDLQIADYTVEVQPSPDMSYQDALLLAMNKEKKAFQLYLDLADAINDAQIKELFMILAQEEAKHKLRFELEYDQVILSEN